MQEGPPRRRRARPVADAPIDALLARAEDLTKGWLLALLEQAPLDEAPAILAADLARDGPRVCEAIVRALAGDDDLRRIEPGGALELLVSQTGEFAGARGVEATSRAVDALRDVIWSAIRGELPRPDPDQISELAERLARVTELVRGAALRRCEGVAPAHPASGPVPPEAPVEPGGRDALSAEPGRRDAPEGEPGRRDAPEGEPYGQDASVASDRRSGSASVRAFTGPGAAAAPSPAPDPLWVGAVEDEIARAQRSGSPLSLLLVELEEADRVVAVEPSREASVTFGRFAQAVRSVVRRQDILACETDTRAWIIARDTGRGGAHALGARIAGAVGAGQPWRGAPMTVTLGVAVLGEDGRDCASLIEAADVARFAAQASGLGIIHAVPSEEAELPGGPGPELVS